MRSIKPSGLLPGVRAQAIGLPGHACLSVSAMWRLDGGGMLCHDGDIWNTITKEGSGLFDVGLPKVRGEVLAEGYAFCSPAAIGAQVRLALGPVDKRLYVIGDREWRTTGPTDPTPYDKMRISWETAFGGEGDKKNPVGRGRGAVTVEGKKGHPMPNVEWPGKLVKSPGDSVPPAGFGPIDLTWEPRCKRTGTYDDRWLKTRHPDYPEDFDPLFFNVAPEDQWLPEFFKGDEAFVIEGMHPEKPRLEGALPGLVARALVRMRDARRGGAEPGSDAEAPIDVAMHLDTVWFFPHVERIGLVWRGGFPIAVDDEREVTEVLVALERLGAPRSIEHYEEVRRQRLDKKRGPLHALRDSDLLPEGVRVARPRVDKAMEEALEREGSVGDNLRRRAESELQQQRQRLRDRGMDPDKHLPRTLPPRENLLEDDLVSFMEKIDARASDARAQAEAHREAALADLKKRLAAKGMNADTILEKARRQALGPPQFSAEKEIAILRDARELSKKSGVPMPAEAMARLDDPSFEQKLRDMEKMLKDAYRKTVHRVDAVPPLHPDDSAAKRARVERAIGEKESLAGQDLTGVDLTGLDFSGMDLREVFLESARVEGCHFDGADLSGAVLAHARAAGASFQKARLPGANLGGADLRGASFAGAIDLAGANFFRADLSRADLAGTTLANVDISEAKLAGATLRGCRAKELTLTRVKLGDSDVREVDFFRCNFLEADVQRANFTGARLDKCVFLDVMGEGAVLCGASLKGLRVVKAEKGSSFAGADFRGADLSTSNLRGADLSGAVFAGALMFRADLSEARLMEAKLTGVRAVESRFERADLTGADLEGADLMHAILIGARVGRANLERANLFRAEASRLSGDDKTSLKGANVTLLHFVPNRGTDG